MAKRRRRRRITGAALGAARAPKSCKVALSRCMKGGRSRSRAGSCMRMFNRCRGV